MSFRPAGGGNGVVQVNVNTNNIPSPTVDTSQLVLLWKGQGTFRDFKALFDICDIYKRYYSMVSNSRQMSDMQCILDALSQDAQRIVILKMIGYESKYAPLDLTLDMQSSSLIAKTRNGTVYWWIMILWNAARPKTIKDVLRLVDSIRIEDSDLASESARILFLSKLRMVVYIIQGRFPSPVDMDQLLQGLGQYEEAMQEYYHLTDLGKDERQKRAYDVNSFQRMAGALNFCNGDPEVVTAKVYSTILKWNFSVRTYVKGPVSAFLDQDVPITTIVDHVAANGLLKTLSKVNFDTPKETYKGKRPNSFLAMEEIAEEDQAPILEEETEVDIYTEELIKMQAEPQAARLSPEKKQEVLIALLKGNGAMTIQDQHGFVIPDAWNHKKMGDCFCYMPKNKKDVQYVKCFDCIRRKKIPDNIHHYAVNCPHNSAEERVTAARRINDAKRRGDRRR
jgi:hypothetical protein